MSKKISLVTHAIGVMAPDLNSPEALSVCVLYQGEQRKDEANSLATDVRQALKLAKKVCTQINLAKSLPDDVRDAYNRVLLKTSDEGELEAMLGPSVALCSARIIAGLERKLSEMQTRTRTLEMMIEELGKKDG